MKQEKGMLPALWALLRVPVPPDRPGYLAFGWMIVVLLVVQGVTGILLSVYYEPSQETAAASVELLMRDVDFGWLLRGVHHWNATALIALAMLQLFRVLAMGTYRNGRAASWYLGFVLLLVTFAEGYTGDVLPWDNEAYWTLRRSLEAIETIPWIGSWLATSLRGGDEVTGHALSRVHMLHTQLLPWLAGALIVLHLWLYAWRRADGRSD